jgi:hypothetical protein
MEEKEILAKKTLKLDNKKSLFAKEPPIQNDFEGLSEDVAEKIKARRQRAVELSAKFWELIKDQYLPDNKGPIRKSTETELLQNLINYAVEVNLDEHEQEGMGSMAMITLLLKTCLYLKDQNNLLKYKLDQLTEKVDKKSSEPQQ